MKLKIIVETKQLLDLHIEKGKIYEVDPDQPVVNDMYKIKVPMKRKGRFRFALIKDEEGVLVNNQ